MNVLMCVNISSKEYNCSSYQDQSLKGVLFLRTQESIRGKTFLQHFTSSTWTFLMCVNISSKEYNCLSYQKLTSASFSLHCFSRILSSYPEFTLLPYSQKLYRSALKWRRLGEWNNFLFKHCFYYKCYLQMATRRDQSGKWGKDTF